MCNSLKTGILICLFFCFSSVIVRGQINKLIVVDALVAGESTEIVSGNSDAKALILPDKGNPLQQITAEIKKGSYDEIHLYLLTKPGSVIFDEINIIPDNVQEFSADFAEWKKYLKRDAVVIIHSENLASVSGGVSLVNSISAYIDRKVLVEK